MGENRLMSDLYEENQRLKERIKELEAKHFSECAQIAHSVIHCKDCKYAQNPNDTMVYCTYFECGTMSQNDFCSQGERSC